MARMILKRPLALNSLLEQHRACIDFPHDSHMMVKTALTDQLDPKAPISVIYELDIFGFLLTLLTFSSYIMPGFFSSSLNHSEAQTCGIICSTCLNPLAQKTNSD